MQQLIFLACLYSSMAIAESNYLSINSNQFGYVALKGENSRKESSKENHNFKNTKTWKAKAKAWEAKAKAWEAKAKAWEVKAKIYDSKYGWINDQYLFCSMNKPINIFGRYDSPTCYKPMKPFCSNSLYSKCSKLEVQSYNTELEQWVDCRKEYIRQAKDDAGCALVKIKEGIEKAIDGN